MINVGTTPAVDATGSTYRDPNGRSTESYSVYVARGDELELLHSERVQAQLAGLSTLGFVYEYVTRHSMRDRLARATNRNYTRS